MNRLVIAVVILLGVLLGLRLISSPLFQRNVTNQVNTPATRSTGFSTEARNNTATTTALPQNTQYPPSTQNPSNTQYPATTTPLPPQTRPAIPAGW